MNDEASRFGPRLYGLFNDLEDGPSVDNDQGEGDGPTRPAEQSTGPGEGCNM